MFEQGLAYLLKKFLGSFVEDGDAIKEKVQLGAWSGLIVLENLRLKSSLLSLVDIPISLAYGYIGRFELRIPWGNLGVEPVLVVIDKVYVVIEPKYEWNPGAADRREQAMKQAKLAAAELFANKRLAVNTEGQSYGDYAKSWLMTSFINKIIDNIQVTVREVHVRYEDQQSCQSNFCVGITLESLHVQSRENSFSFEEAYSPRKDVPRSAFASDSERMQPELKTQGYETFHKLIQVNHLSMYWNPLVPSGLNACCCIFRGRPPAEIQNFMYRTIPTRVHQVTDRPRHHYILLPVDINNYLDMSFNTSTGVAKANVKLVITDLAICLEDLQVREIISVAINMGSFAKLQRFSEFRPAKSISDAPAAWWRYAINAVLLQIRIDRKKHLSLKQISLRHRDKLVYTELWKSKLVSPAAVLNQLSRTEDGTKPVLDRENSAVYQAAYQRAKLALDAAQAKENLQRGPTVTHKGSKQSKFTVSLNNATIPTEEDKNSGRAFTSNTPLSKTLLTASTLPQPGPVQPLTKETIELLQTLEYLLDFEDIVLFRSLAEKDLSLEATTRSWIGGWMSWVGSGGQAGAVSEEEKRKLFEALKYDPDRLLRGGMKEVNQNEVMAIVSVQVHKMSVTLALTSPEMSSTFQTSIPFLKLELEDMRNRSVIMGDGAHVSVSVSLQDFSAYEILATTSALSAIRNEGPRNKILFRRELRGGGPTAAQQSEWGQSSVNSKYMESSVDRSSMGRSSSRHRSEDVRPLFSTVIEILPPNKDTDVIVQLTVEELEVWVSPTAKWTSAMATFVAWPADQQYWSEMEMGAMNQLADFKARFDAKIEYMMQNHQNIIIEARVKAPVVVISDQSSTLESGAGDVLVIDLGLITLTTETLAKAQRQKLIDARSHTGFTSDATNTTPMRSRSATVDKTRGGAENVAVNLNFSERKLPPVPEPAGWEVLADEAEDADGEDSPPPLRLMTPPRSGGGTDTPMKSPGTDGLRKADLANLSSEYEAEEKSTEGASSSYMAGAYGSMPAPSIVSTVHTAGLEFDQDDASLFDIFQCQVSQIEVYLISAAVISDAYSGDLDASKTVIVDKFEVSVEIHVSVLPWDITIPPVKLILDIPEINVKLSEPKLVRLKQFSTELITDDSQAMLSSNLARINQLNAMLKRKNSDIGGGSKSRAVSSRLSLMSNASSMLNIRSKSRRTMSLGEASSVNDMTFFDTVTGRNSMKTNPMHDSNGVTVTGSRKSALRTESRRTRSRAGSASYQDSIDNDIPIELRLKKLVDTSYVVGSEDGDAPREVNVRDPENDQGGEDGDGDDDDDDSFFSVFENMNSEEHAKQKDHLQFVISQRESIRTKLMSDIRTSEADPTKAALHETLKKELVLCEQELQQLRVAFVELLMSTEDLDLYTSEEDAKAVRNFHDGLLLPVHSVETGEKQVGGPLHKRDLAQASVFKVPPTKAKQQLKDNSNRELVYVRANVNVVNVDLECTPDAKLIGSILGASAEKPKKGSKHGRKSQSTEGFAPLLPIVTCRLKLCGISMKVRHRSQDSRLGFAMQELDVEDFIQVPVLGSAGADASGKAPTRARASSIFLLSSDPANFGLYALPMVSRYNSRGSTDLLKMKYEVVYGADTLDENGDERDGDFQDTHNVKLSMGLIGVNIEQSRIALLLLTVHKVLQNAGLLPPVDAAPAAGSPSTAAALPAKPSTVAAPSSNPSGRNLMPNVIFWAKVECVCVSLLAKSEPLLTLHMWALTCSVQSRCLAATVSLRMADFSAFCMKRIPDEMAASHGRKDEDAWQVQKVLLFGRDPSSMLPFISTSLHLEQEGDHSMTPPLVIASVKTVPVVVSADLDCIHSIIREILQGPIMEVIPIFSGPPVPAAPPAPVAMQNSQAPKPPPGAMLDAMMNPLVDMCNGRIEVVLGAVTFVCADAQEGSASQDYRFDSSSLMEKNELRVSLRTIEANIMWGDICEFGAVQGTVAIQGVKLSCTGNDMNDPIDVFCKISAMPNSYFVPPNQSDTVANLTFNTPFPPPEQPEVERNMCQVAIGVSPITLHVHEGILAHAVSWAAFVVPAAERIQLLLAPNAPAPDPNAVELLPVPRLLNSGSAPPAIDIDCAVTVSVLLYEVVVSMEVAASSPVPAKSAASKSDPLSQSMATSATNLRGSSRKAKQGTPAAPPIVTGPAPPALFLPIFRLVVRKIGSEIALKPDFTRTGDAPAREYQTPGMEGNVGCALACVTCGVDSVDFEHIKFSGTTYKRLLSTGIFGEHCPSPKTLSQQCMTTASNSSTVLMEQDIFNMSNVDDDDEEATFRFLTVDAALLTNRTVRVDVHMDNIHVTLITDAVLAMIALGDIYAAAVLPRPPVGLRRKTLSKSNLRGAGAADAAPRPDDGSTYNNYYFAHPSSVPMAPSTSTGETSNVQLTPVSPLPVTLLTSNSFALADLVRSVDFTLSLTSFYAYLPSERRNGAGPAVCTALNVEADAQLLPVDRDRWQMIVQEYLPEVDTSLPSGEEKQSASVPASPTGGDVRAEVFTTARCVLNSMEVFLVKSLPQDICNPVPALEVAVPSPQQERSSPMVIRSARFPPSPRKDLTPRSVAPETPLSTHTSNTSLAERTSVGHDAPARYHSKALIFPFGAEVLYSAAVEVRSATAAAHGPVVSALCQDAVADGLNFSENAALEFSQRLSLEVQSDLEIQGFLDIRPFVRMFETSIKPIVDAVDAKIEPASTKPSVSEADSGARSRHRDSSVSRDEKSSRKGEAAVIAAPTLYLRDFAHVHQIGTLFDVLGALGAVSSLQASVSVPNLVIYVINDIYVQPVSIARINGTGITVAAEVLKPWRASRFLSLHDPQRATSPEQDSGEEFPAEGAELMSSSLVRGVRFLAGNNQLLSPERIQSVRTALLDKFTSSSALVSSNLPSPSAAAEPAGENLIVPWISVTTKATIGIEYYNQRLIAREPLIEPFPVHVAFTMPQPTNVPHGPVLMLLNRRSVLERAPRSDDYCFADALARYINDERDAPAATAAGRPVAVDAPMKVQVDIPEPITVNLTMALTEILMVTAQTVSAAATATPDGVIVKEPDAVISMLGIRNDSGLQLRYWTHSDMAPLEVPPNTEAPLQIEHSFDMRRGNFAGDNALDGRYTTARYINISVHDVEHDSWPELHDIPLEGVGTRLFNVDFQKQKLLAADPPGSKTATSGKRNGNAPPLAPSLALELVSRGGNKILIVRSTIRIFNSTKATFRVELVSGFRNTRREVLWDAVVPPNQGIPVPANLCNVPNGRFIVKPMLHLQSRSCEGCFWPVYAQADVANDQSRCAEVPIPGVPGLSLSASSGQSSPDNVSEEAGADPVTDPATATEETSDPVDGKSLPGNHTQWRRQLIQQRGSANVQTYSHWLSMDVGDGNPGSAVGPSNPFAPPIRAVAAALTAAATAAYCNLSVSSKGVPRHTQANAARSADSCMLRTLTFTAPITVVNLTAGAIAVAITPDLSKFGQTNNLEALLEADPSIGGLVPHAALHPGESWDFLAAHAYSDVSVSLKFAAGSGGAAGAVSSICDVWSDALLISGCRSKGSDTTTYSVDVPYLNGSRLSVQLEVVDSNGNRVVNIYVPYWVVSNSFLPLQYQHDTWYAANGDKFTNGTDGLAADQSYTIIPHSTVGKAAGLVPPKSAVATSRSLVPHSGLGRARGLDGVVLGPELPSRGLVDLLTPAPGLARLHNRHTVRRKLAELKRKADNESLSSLHSALDRFTRSPSMTDEVTDFTFGGPSSNNAVRAWAETERETTADHSWESNGTKKKPYNIMQCGYSYKEKRSAKLRLRTGATSQWSSYFSLDSAGTSTLEVASAPRDPSAEDADIVRVMPHMANARGNAGGRIFSFGMQVAHAEPPFHRTQVVVLADRYVMINAVGHPIEVRQVGHDSVFSLRSEDEVPLWWGAGAQVLHMRLARYGWSWSGKFPVNAEGEFSIRLRNDFDNTVFFVLVHVMMKGPYMYVIFKGGEKFSPYRFENHTLSTFKIKQKGQSPCTVLLPYHSSAYAWDEPLTPHFVCIEVLKNALQSQDEWGTVGTFSFDALGPLNLPKGLQKGPLQYLLLKVVAQGPTRVLQIFDRRILQGSERLPASLGNGTVAGRMSGRVPFPAFYVSGAQSGDALSDELRRAPKIVQIDVNISSVGVSLVDHVPQELIYVSVSGIRVKHSLYPQQEITELEVQRLQVDNQLWSTPYPSLLYPLLSNQKFISLELHRDTRYAGVEFIPLLKFSLAPFDINLDGTIIVRLLETASYVVELLESTYTATHSRAYSRLHLVSPPAQAGPHTPQKAATIKRNAGNAHVLAAFSPIPPSVLANRSAITAGDAAWSVSLSYHDSVDFVAHSPFAHSPRGEKLRPSQVDNIHSILHTLASHQQQRMRKQLQFTVPDSESKAKRPIPGKSGTVHLPQQLQNSRQTKMTRHASAAGADKSSLPLSLDSNRGTMSHFFVRKMLDAIATPSGYANPTAKVYLQRLELSEIRLNASFNPVVANDSGTTTISEVSLLQTALHAVVLAIGSAFAKIENCPIRFRPYSLDHVFTSGNNLGMMFAKNYALQAVSQSYIVIFSSEVLGNPVRLIYTLGEGLWDFLYLPAKGLLESPKAFVGGAIQGTTSLVRTVVASVLSTAGSLAASLQVGLITLGVVDHYPAGPTEHRAMAMLTDAQNVLRKPEERRGTIESLLEEEAQDAGEDVANSSAARSRLLAATQTVQEMRPQTLFNGLKVGIAGLIFDPMTGFRVDGVKGLVIGIAKGSFGLLARPLYGALGFTSQKLDQVSFYFQPRFLASQKLRLQRVRSPRFFRSPNQPLRVYSSDENMGQDLLSRVNQGEYRREGYLWHAVLKDKSVLLLTKVRILIVSSGFEVGEIVWNCPMSKMRSLDVEYVANKPNSTAEQAKQSFNAGAHRLTASRLNMNMTKDSSARSGSDSRLMHTPAAHSVATPLLNFECTLEGQPTLHIYHEPLQSAQGSLSPSRSANRLGSARKETGFRLAHKIIRVASHRQLLELLSVLLRLFPALTCADVLQYLEAAGVNTTEALRQQGSLRSGARRL